MNDNMIYFQCPGCDNVCATRAGQCDIDDEIIVDAVGVFAERHERRLKRYITQRNKHDGKTWRVIHRYVTRQYAYAIIVVPGWCERARVRIRHFVPEWETYNGGDK